MDLVMAYHQIPVYPEVIQYCNYHTLRPFLIFFHVLWLKKCCPNLSAFYELNLTTLGLLFRLSGRYPCL
jgi:hypothetical protein